MGILSRVRSWLRPPPSESAEVLEQRNRLLQLEIDRRLMENAWFGPGDWVSAYQGLLMRDYPDRISVGTISSIADRRAGRDFPLYLNETDLNVYRAPARILCGTNNYAIGLIRGMTGYIIGTGFAYQWQSRGIVRGTKRARDDAKNPLVQKMQEITEEFLEREFWPELEAELYWRDREDGEAFLLHGIDPRTGRMWVRTIEPEQVYLPTMVDPEILAGFGVERRKAVDAWTFGILTDPEDVQTRFGYAIHDLLNPAEYDFEESAFMVHTKTTPRKRSIKRGLTDFSFDMLDAMNAAQKLRRNLGIGAAVQAAMAGIRQQKEASAAQVDAMQTTTRQFTKTVQGKTVNYANLQPGSLIDIDGQSEFVAPPSGANAMPHLEILEGVLRGAAMKYNAPQWLGSGKSDAGSFASSLTAESPFIKTGIFDQMYYVGKRKRTMHLLRQFAVEQGLIDPRALTELECDCEPPRIQVRNPEEQARVDQIYNQMGVKSKQRIAMEQTWDYDEEIDNIKEDAKNNPQAQPQPGEKSPAVGATAPDAGLPERGGQPFPHTRESRDESAEERIAWLKAQYGEETTARIVEAAERLNAAGVLLEASE